MAMAWAALLLLAIFLPVNFLSLISRLVMANPNNKSNNMKRPWMLPFVSIPLLLSVTILAVSDLDSSSSRNAELIVEVESLKTEIARLESTLEETTDTLNSKTRHLDENNKMIEEMENKLQSLQNFLRKIKASKGSTPDSETMVTALEEEVRLLWAESRKNNFNYHILESKAYEEENKVKELTSEVVKMENVIIEQWIQIRQLEQSLQMMKIMTSNVHKKSISKVHKKKPTMFSVFKVPQNLIHIGSGKTLITSLHVLLQQIFNTSKLMSKFIKGLHHRFLPDEADLPDSFFLGNYISKSSTSQAVDKFRRMWSAVKRWHYELQAFVKWALEVNEFTAPLSNKEVIFFVASAVVVMPLMSAWALFL